MSASTRWLAGTAGAIVLLVVGAVAVIALAGGEREFAEGTPERAVQQYLAAVADRDARAASSFMSSDLEERCRDYPHDAVTRRDERSIRATLDETIEHEDGVSVLVGVTERYGSGGPFDSGEYAQSVVFELVQEDGAWRFSEPPWPYYCPPEPATGPRG